MTPHREHVTLVLPAQTAIADVLTKVAEEGQAAIASTAQRMVTDLILKGDEGAWLRVFSYPDDGEVASVELHHETLVCPVLLNDLEVKAIFTALGEPSPE